MEANEAEEVETEVVSICWQSGLDQRYMGQQLDRIDAEQQVYERTSVFQGEDECSNRDE